MVTEVNNGEVKSKAKVIFSDLAFSSVFALSFFISILLSGCNPPAGSAIQSSEPYSAEQRKKELIAQLDRRFNNPLAQFELGQIYHTERQWEQAQFRYNQALSFDPVYRDVQAAMVEMFIDRGQPDKAQTYAENYINQASSSAKHSLALALAFQKLELDDYAMQCYEQALKLSPDSAEVHKELGFFYLSKNDKINAEKHFVISFENDNTQRDVSNELGKLGIKVSTPE